MLEEKIIERIANINFEDAMEELYAISPTMSSTDSNQWFNIYENFMNDRRAFRMVNMTKAYNGESDGSFNQLAQARLKLLSYYTWRLQ